MTKVKVFRFRVSNFTSTFNEEKKCKANTHERKCLSQLVTEEEIECTINSFLTGKELVSINVNTIDINYHNNGYGNIVDIIYTIAYK